MTGRLTLSRGGGWCDRWRAYRIEVNGMERAHLKRNSRVTLELEPGEHEISARIDWCGSNRLTLKLEAGTDVCVRVWNPHRPWQLQSVMIRAPEAYLALMEIPDRVTESEPGP